MLIIVGSFTWTITMVKSGVVYDYGMGFWGPNGHDGIWHIAVIKSLSDGTWGMPVFAGEMLQNYHIGYDLLLAWIHKLTFIPVVSLYFQILPILIAFGVGISVYKFVYDWTKSKNKAFWSTFFTYFGGSLGYLVTYFKDGTLGGESIFWSQQAISTLINPPFALSLIIIFMGLDLLMLGINVNKKTYLVASTILFGSLAIIKVYAGLLVLGGLLIASLFMIFKERNWKVFRIFSGALILSILLFLPLNRSSTSSIEFVPFWFLETMMALSDRFGWERYYSAMTNYKLGGQWLKFVLSYTGAFFIFIVGNFGFRLLGIILIGKWIIDLKKLTYLDLLFISVILAGVGIPMLFLQKGTPWNTIQFMYYSLTFGGILAGMSIGHILDKFKNSNKLSKAILYFILVMLVLLTIPTTFSSLKYNYIPNRPPAKVSMDELRALEFLSNQSNGVVLTYPYSQKLAKLEENNPPRSLYLYESTSYVSALSGKHVFLEDEVNLNITGYDWPKRRLMVEDFLSTNDQFKAREFLRTNNIKYIYWLNGQRAALGETQLGIKKIFENNTVNIFEVEN